MSNITADQDRAARAFLAWYEEQTCGNTTAADAVADWYYSPHTDVSQTDWMAVDALAADGVITIDTDNGYAAVYRP